MTHIDDQPIDLKDSDQGVLVDHGRERPLGIKHFLSQNLFPYLPKRPKSPV